MDKALAAELERTTQELKPDPEGFQRVTRGCAAYPVTNEECIAILGSFLREDEELINALDRPWPPREAHGRDRFVVSAVRR